MKVCKKWIKSCMTIVLMSVIVLFSLLVAGGYQSFQRALHERPIAVMMKEIRQNSSYTKLSEIPRIYQDAIIAAEDPRFYSHNGIDLFAIADALVRDIKARDFVAGGSTITQQLCKNQFFTQKKTFTRKFAEVFMVRDVESHCSKSDILELYINSIYYGNGYYTLFDASMGYFQKIPSDLNAWECTMLAGLPNAPSAYAPTVNPELALERQKQVLDAMVQHGYLTQCGVEEILRQCPEHFQ